MIQFESKLKKRGNEDNPSYAVTIPKHLAKGRLKFSKKYKIIIKEV